MGFVLKIQKVLKFRCMFSSVASLLLSDKDRRDWAVADDFSARHVNRDMSKCRFTD